MTAGVVRAAGGVVSRAGKEICLVHRPRYDDWSLPKGKLLAGEAPLVAAVREVFEETGVRAAVLAPLPSTQYASRGLPKIVGYWSMRVVTVDSFTPGSEVDDVRWVAVPDALALLTYPHDASVVKAFAVMRPVTGVVVLLRHASAGDRGSWPGPDAARPLDATGEAQAVALAELLAVFAPTRLVSASPRRCVATLSPLAASLDLPVEVDAVFDESADPAVAARRIERLATAEPSTVVCSQGGLIPGVLSTLRRNAGEASSSWHRREGQYYHTPKGTGWLLPFSGADLLDAHALPATG